MSQDQSRLSKCEELVRFVPIVAQRSAHIRESRLNCLRNNQAGCARQCFSLTFAPSGLAEPLIRFLLAVGPSLA